MTVEVARPDLCVEKESSRYFLDGREVVVGDGVFIEGERVVDGRSVEAICKRLSYPNLPLVEFSQMLREDVWETEDFLDKLNAFADMQDEESGVNMAEVALYHVQNNFPSALVHPTEFDNDVINTLAGFAYGRGEIGKEDFRKVLEITDYFTSDGKLCVPTSERLGQATRLLNSDIFIPEETDQV